MSRRLSVTVLVATALVALATTAQAAFTPPKWYHGKDGPLFEVLKTDGDIEQRHYDAGKWAVVNITGSSSFDDSWSKGMSKLDDLWKGGSQEKAKIDATVPMFGLLYPTGQGRTLTSTFTIEKFLPHELHGSPPTPLDQDLSIITVQAYDVWVKQFGGFAREDDIIDQAFTFMDDLKAKGVDVNMTTFGFAMYDNPTRLVDRHNEIWVWENSPTPSTFTAILAFLRERLAVLSRRPNVEQPAAAFPAQ